MTKFLSVLLLFSAYLIPTYILLRPEYFVVTIIALFSLFNNRKPFCVLQQELKLFVILAALAILSIIGELIITNQFSERDLMIFPRYAIYCFAMISGAYAFIQTRNSNLLEMTFNLIFATAVVFSFIQYFNIFNLNHIITPFYDENDDLLISGAHWRRVFGTLGNPNYWGLFLAVGCARVGYSFFVKRNLVTLPFVLALIICIVMTGSRTSLIAIFFGLFIGVQVLNKTASRTLTQKLFGFLFGLLAITLIFLIYDLFVSLFYEDKGRFDISNTYTLELRLAYWQHFLLDNLNQPYKLFIGRGPSKASNAIFGDNMYLLIFRDFGLFALITFLLLWKKIIQRLFFVSQSLPKFSKPPLEIGFIIAITFAIFDLAADAWFNVRLAIPMLFGYGYLIMSVKYKGVTRLC